MCCVCEDLGLGLLWLKNAYQIKHSLGVHRGKNDKVDDRRIAEYTARFHDKANLFG
jgi:hypothetical protein